jgi:hypothetical protein
MLLRCHKSIDFLLMHLKWKMQTFIRMGKFSHCYSLDRVNLDVCWWVQVKDKKFDLTLLANADILMVFVEFLGPRFRYSGVHSLLCLVNMLLSFSQYACSAILYLLTSN